MTTQTTNKTRQLVKHQLWKLENPEKIELNARGELTVKEHMRKRFTIIPTEETHVGKELFGHLHCIIYNMLVFSHVTSHNQNLNLDGAKEAKYSWDGRDGCWLIGAKTKQKPKQKKRGRRGGGVRGKGKKKERLWPKFWSIRTVNSNKKLMDRITQCNSWKRVIVPPCQNP